MAEKKSIRLPANISLDLGCIQADERRLQQALINLLSNVVQFTLNGGNVTQKVKSGSQDGQQLGASAMCLLPSSISPTPALDGSYFCFSVIDPEIGIPQDKLDTIFRPFVQVDSALNRQCLGTGLGLALVQQIVNSHQGTIAVESKVGQGRRFVIQLPHYIDGSGHTGRSRTRFNCWDKGYLIKPVGLRLLISKIQRLLMR